jgi:hypothetical protein
MTLRIILIFTLALLSGIAAAPAQDIFLKPGKDQAAGSSAARQTPQIFLAPNPSATKAAPNKKKQAFPKEITLRDKALQKATNEKIRAFKAWHTKGKKPQTPEEYLEYASLARAITHAQNLERREALFASLAEQQKRAESYMRATQAPAQAQPVSKKPAAPEQKDSGRKKIYNDPRGGFKPPTKVFTHDQ